MLKYDKDILDSLIDGKYLPISNIIKNIVTKCKTQAAFYIITSNRSGGKTFNTLKFFIDEFFKNEKQFMIFYKTNAEIKQRTGVCDELNTISEIYNLGCFFKEKKIFNNLKTIVCVVGEEEKEVGFISSLNSAYENKKRRSQFKNVYYTLIDEFQSLKYSKNEVELYQTYLDTIFQGGARCGVNVLLSNSLSISNPYYQAFELTSKITPDTKIIKTNEVVFIKYVNEFAKKQYVNSPITKALRNTSVSLSSAENEFFKDNSTNVKKLKLVKFTYLANLHFNKNIYSLKEIESGYYISKSIDETFNEKYDCLNNFDDIPKFKGSYYYFIVCDAFKKGCLFFENQIVKNDLLKAIKVV